MPIFRYPFFYNNYYGNYYNRPYSSKQGYLSKSTDNGNFHNSLHNNSNKYQDNSSINFDSSHTESDDSNIKNNFFELFFMFESSLSGSEYFFELFGLKLYFDDILLICLIFFLYQEGVKDDELFISLILLLLS